MKPSIVFALAAISLGGCATTPRDFYSNPTKAGTTALCRAQSETTDPVFQRDVVRELLARGMTSKGCEDKIVAENIAIVGVAAVATGVVVAAACSDGCGGYPSGGAGYGGTDYDCAGGGGDGPLFVRGPFRLDGPDTYGLDSDRDGIACEPYGDYGS